MCQLFPLCCRLVPNLPIEYKCRFHVSDGKEFVGLYQDLYNEDEIVLIPVRRTVPLHKKDEEIVNEGKFGVKAVAGYLEYVRDRGGEEKVNFKVIGYNMFTGPARIVAKSYFASMSVRFCFLLLITLILLSIKNTYLFS